MKRKITVLALAAAILLAAAPSAFAANGHAPAQGCQPGANNDIVEAWQMLSVAQFAQLLVDEFNAPDYQAALERAIPTYDFNDHNGDGYACVMVQNLPNDVNGFSKFWLVEDNHPFGGS